jgi:protease-4
MSSERSILTRFFIAIWNIIDGTRKLILNLVFFAIFFFVVAALVDSGEPLGLQGDTALVLRPYGRVVEQYSGTPFDMALQQASDQLRPETRLRDLVEAVHRATDDADISRMVIDPTFLSGIGMASLLELEAAIAGFKASGKPVITLADNLGQGQYYLAALADDIWLNPEGMVWLDGFAAYRNYYRDGLDKLEVEINLFRAGEYKSAMEPFVRNDMSPEVREANLYWIGNLWQQYLEGVSRQRGIPLERLSSTINGFADGLEAADGDFARYALEAGLVDKLVSRPEANQSLAQLGAPGQGSEGFRQVDSDTYLDLTDMQHRPGEGTIVLVIVAEGDIVRGRQPQGLIGAESLTDRLRKAAANKDVGAVVLRINSPGGDAFASEKVRREVQALAETGKTVVVSMGDVAASGGYWIAMAVDEVWASPSTITGSIGVIGIFPTFARPLEKLGISSDGVGTTPLAGKLRLDRPLDDNLRRIFQHATEQTYEDFLRLISEARNMSIESVEKVAGGRVWSGVQAKERGLVDQTGTLQQSIDAAARIAGLGTDYQVLFDERELDAFESLLIEMTGSVARSLGLGNPLAPLIGSDLFTKVVEDLRFLLRTNGDFTLAAHCLCGS